MSLAMYASDYNNTESSNNNPIQKKRDNIRHNKTLKRKEGFKSNPNPNPKMADLVKKIHDDEEDDDEDFDKSNLSNININEIEKFIKTFKNQINQYIITGHTDTVGSNNYNYKLSIERATEVKKILIKLGIDKDNINILGKSENDLKIKTGNNIAHPANRRAEIGLLN